MADSGKVQLVVDGVHFFIRKDLLSEYSDYFRAMFSGNYVENEKSIITIDMVDAHSMALIEKYMKIGLIDLSEHSKPVIGDLLVAANFLQITELIKQIEYCLEQQLSLENWVESMEIGQNGSSLKLEQYSAVYGLFSFKFMKIKYIPTMQKLYWYLSHPYLDADSESQVFKFGIRWIMNKHADLGGDALIVVLSCIDMSRLTREELLVMKDYMTVYVDSLASKVMSCLYRVITNFYYEITEAALVENKQMLCDLYTEQVYNVALNLVKDSIQRKLIFTPAVPLWPPKESPLQKSPQYLSTFSEDKGYQRWLEIAEKDLWGWSIVSWGATKLVVVCGEYGKGSGSFMRDVRVYDIFKKEWIRHGVELPSRRHSGVAVVEDSLYIIGGVGGFRIVLDSALVYDLKLRSFRKIASFPDAIQGPAVCAHEKELYAAGQKNIYQYEDLGSKDRWKLVLETNLRPNCLISYQGYIYVTQGYFNSLHRFKPGVDTELELVTGFSNPPAAICDLGMKLLAFTGNASLAPDVMVVEEYEGRKDPKNKPSIIWSQTGSESFVNGSAGSCSVVMDVPPIHPPIPEYHKKILADYDLNFNTN